MQIFETKMSDLKRIVLPRFEDTRGTFVKTFHDTIFKSHYLNFSLKESYFSISNKNVIRGMHFQLPPHDHAKIVFCPMGEILDVVVDLRKESDTYGNYESFKLSGQNNEALYIPPGFAHGFLSLEDHSITQYLVSSEYSSESDSGILFNSFGMDWKVLNPIISQRDSNFLPLSEFNSPF